MSRKWLAAIIAGVLVIAVVVVVVLVAGGDDDDGTGVRTIGCDPSSSDSASASASASAPAAGSASAPASGSASAPASGSASGSPAATGSPAASGSASGSGSASRDPCPSASASGSASASASGSASGLSASDLGGGAESVELQDAVDQYRTYVDQQVDDTITKATAFTDAVRAGNVDAAKAAYAPSRAGWESIEPIAGLVEEIDGAVDARVDDFAGEDDPEFTGWHRLEYHLWSLNSTAGTTEFADRLDADLQTLKSEVAEIEITPLAMARGASELIEEVSEGKITGEEDRYSGTDLWDFAANVDGSEKVIELLTPALQTADPELLSEIEASFGEVDATLSKYANGDGSYQPFSALSAADTAALKASLAHLSEELAEVPGVLGLR